MNTVDAICFKYTNTNPGDSDLDPNDAFYQRSKKLLPHLHNVRVRAHPKYSQSSNDKRVYQSGMVRQLTAQARTVEAAADDAQRMANDVQRLSDEVRALALESHGLTKHARKLMCEKQRLMELEKEQLTGRELDLTALEKQDPITSSAASQAVRFTVTPELASDCDKLMEEANGLRMQAESIMAKATQSANTAELVSIEASRTAQAAVNGAGELKLAMNVLVTVDMFIKELEVMWEMMAMKMTVVEE